MTILLSNQEMDVFTICKYLSIMFDLDTSSRTAWDLSIGLLIERKDDVFKWIADNTMVENLLSMNQNKYIDVGSNFMKNHGLHTIKNDKVHITRIFINIATKLDVNTRHVFIDEAKNIIDAGNSKHGIYLLTNFYQKWKEDGRIAKKIEMFMIPHYVRRIFPWAQEYSNTQSYVIYCYYIYIFKNIMFVYILTCI